MTEKSRTIGILYWAAMVIGILVIAAVIGHDLWLHRSAARMYRDAPYVKLKVYSEYTESEGRLINRKYREYEIKDRDVIRELWSSMEYFDSEQVLHSDRQVESDDRNFATLSYPTDITIEAEEGPSRYEYPIYLFSDGRSKWGMAPDSSSVYWTPKLLQYVETLIENIESEKGFTIITEGTEEVYPSFQEQIQLGILDLNTPDMLGSMEED